MARIWALGAIGLAATLSACGGGAPAGNATAGAATTAGATASDVLDACKTLDKSVVEASLGGKVQTAELSAVNDGSNGADRFSQCTYGFGDTNMVVFGSGESSDGASESIDKMAERIRKQMAITSVQTEEVSGVGKKALWNSELHALWVFPADGRYYAFTLYKIGQPDQKAAAIALARKFGL